MQLCSCGAVQMCGSEAVLLWCIVAIMWYIVALMQIRSGVMIMVRY